jgi:cell fate (sporulation/competence/biofilm development) regulator YlbF (YheA/YmcA/DUF963 family)
MSVETPAEESTDADDVDALARELGAAIAETPEYEAFEAKSTAVEESDEAQERIEEFEQRRQEFMMARQTGEVTQDDMTDLKRAQQELHEMPVMSEFLAAREQLVDRLEELNEAISAPLTVDFGEEAGGCCQDED